MHKLCHYVVCSHLQQSHLHLFQSTYILSPHMFPLCSPNLLTLPCQTNGWVLTSVLRPWPEPEPGLILSHPLRPSSWAQRVPGGAFLMGTRAKGIAKRLEVVNRNSLSMPAILDERLAGTGYVWEYKSLFFFLCLLHWYMYDLRYLLYNVAMSVWVRNKMGCV